jgi:FkbM family methyltransferase
MKGLQPQLIEERLARLYGIDMLPESCIRHVLDIGANTGIFAIQARFRFPKAQILCIEPDPRNFANLQENVEGLDISCIQAGLGDGSLLACRNEGAKQASLSYLPSPSGAIQSHSLGYYARLNGFDPTKTFVKIDCEGGEGCLIGDEDAERLLTIAPAWGIEIHASRTRDEWIKWLSRFSRHGWVSYHHDVNHLFARVTFNVDSCLPAGRKDK